MPNPYSMLNYCAITNGDIAATWRNASKVQRTFYRTYLAAHSSRAHAMRVCARLDNA